MTPTSIITNKNPLAFWTDVTSVSKNSKGSIFGHTHYKLNPLNKQSFNTNYQFSDYFNSDQTVQTYYISTTGINTKYLNNYIINFNMKSRFNFINIR
jgi:hypothetical protein